jgi:hypothetical protein
MNRSRHKADLVKLLPESWMFIRRERCYQCRQRSEYGVVFLCSACSRSVDKLAYTYNGIVHACKDLRNVLYKHNDTIVKHLHSRSLGLQM